MGPQGGGHLAPKEEAATNRLTARVRLPVAQLTIDQKLRRAYPWSQAGHRQEPSRFDRHTERLVRVDALR